MDRWDLVASLCTPFKKMLKLLSLTIINWTNVVHGNDVVG